MTSETHYGEQLPMYLQELRPHRSWTPLRRIERHRCGSSKEIPDAINRWLLRIWISTGAAITGDDYSCAPPRLQGAHIVIEVRMHRLPYVLEVQVLVELFLAEAAKPRVVHGLPSQSAKS
jgi:hypothetical protein